MKGISSGRGEEEVFSAVVVGMVGIVVVAVWLRIASREDW